MSKELNRISVTIEGVTPLICNRFTDAAAERATSGKSTSNSAIDRGTPMEQAEGKLYRDEGGNLVIPIPNLFRCFIDGGKFFKSGRSKVTTQKSSILAAAMDFGADVTIKIEHKEAWTVDTRPVRIPATGGRILCHRPMFHDWALSFEMVIDTSIISTKLMREIVDAAGRQIGLGDFRPDCKGPFGRFVVTYWSEVD